ncbi:hypothetical protein E4O93_21420 [Diaphorobacter sp. DS2]|nr:hypothetical protein E4O93_21420 [Diaphorobacter sp. DS2]
MLLTAGQLRRFAPAAPAFPNCHAGHGSLPAHTQRGHHRGTGALADGGGHRRRGERRGSDQPSHTQHGRLHRTQRAAAAIRAGTDVKPAPRWPLHPAPKEGEALSSWLNRVALCYHMEEPDLLEHDLGHGQVDDLDTAPPLSLLALLSQRSGIELDRLRCMSFAGWVLGYWTALMIRFQPHWKPMRSSSRYCCRDSAVRRDPSRAGVPGCPPTDTPRLSALPERSGEPSRTARVEAAPDAELPTAWLLAGILLGRARAVSRLGERRRRTAHCQRRDCGDGPAYLAGTDDRPRGVAAPTHPRRIVV